MKSLSTNALAKIQSQYGVEPVLIVGIQWHNDGNEILYSNKSIPGVEPRLLNTGQIQGVVNLLTNGQVSEVNISLSDTDGVLKQIFDQYDIHKQKCTIYQSFAGLSLEDKFVLFRGEISSPITWTESDRSFSFDVITELEGSEAGFSPEQGQFDFVSDDLVGEAWPLVFGECLYVPAKRVYQRVRGANKEAFAVISPVLLRKQLAYQERIAKLQALYAYFIVLHGLAGALVPAIGVLLDDYIDALIDSRTLLRSIYNNQESIANIDKRLADAALTDAEKANLKMARQQRVDAIKQDAADLDLEARRKAEIRDQTRAIEFSLDIRDEAIEKMNEVLVDLFESNEQLKLINRAIAEQQSFVRTEIEILHGDKFPQNQSVEVLIDDVKFGGRFSGQTFTFETGPLATYSNLAIGPRENDDEDLFWVSDPTVSLQGKYCFVTSSENVMRLIRVTEQIGTRCKFELVERATEEPEVPENPAPDIKRIAISQQTLTQLNNANAFPLSNDEMETILELEALLDRSLTLEIPQVLLPGQKYEVIGQNITLIYEASPIILASWLNALTRPEIERLPTDLFFADVGTEWLLSDDDKITYVANIIDSEVTGVFAYRNIDGIQRLASVPESYYEINKQEKEPFDIVTVTLYKSLPSYKEDWVNEELYVSLVSTVGPNTVDIIEWLIETYTGFAIDASSFSTVRSLVNKYPSNFALTEQKNVLELVNEIAWQARCSLWIKEGVVYISYLSAEPEPVKTLTDDDVEHTSIVIKTTETESLVTKLIATWRQDYLSSEPNRLILRHNVSKYGTLENTYDFYIYNIPDLVEKSATYWLIRYSNTWKIVEFTTFLNHLDLEINDAVVLDFSGNVCANGPVTGIVTGVQYDFDNNRVRFEVWLPVKTGTDYPYPLAWPSSVESEVEFPTQDEILLGLAGGGQPANDVTGPIGPFPDVLLNTRPKDYGRRFPSDSADGTFTNPAGNFISAARGAPSNVSVRRTPIDILIESRIREQFKRQGRDVGVGIIHTIENDPDNDRGSIVTVTLRNNEEVTAKMDKRFENDSRVTGSYCIVVMGLSPDDLYAFCMEEDSPIRLFNYQSEGGDVFLCTDTVTDQQEAVAKPQALRATYLNAQGYEVAANFNILRRYNANLPADEQNHYVYLRNFIYAAQEQLVAIRLPSPIELNGFTCKWIDLNVRAMTYERLQFLHGSIAEGPGENPFRLVGENDNLKVILSDFQGLFNPPPYAQVKCPYTFGTEDLAYVTNTYVQIGLVSTGYVLINIEKPAQTIYGTLSADLDSSDAEVNVTVTEYYGGYNPASLFLSGQVKVKNRGGWSSATGAAFKASYAGENFYTIDYVQCVVT